MKKLLLLCLCICFSNLFSQDTLFHKSGEKQAVRVNEIGVNDIKYHRYDNLSGPQYVISKTDVRFIRYANGTVDTIIKYVEIKPQVVASNPVVSSKPSRQSLMFDYTNDRELLYSLTQLPSSNEKSKMLKEYSKMIQYKRNQYAANTLGWVIGFGVPIGTTYYALIGSYSYVSINDPATVIIVGALTGAAIRTIGQVVKKMNQNKRKNSKRMILSMYNQLD